MRSHALPHRPGFGRFLPAALRMLALVWLLVGGASSALAACDVTTPTNVNVGNYSPAAIKAGAPPLINTKGGFGCSSAAILTLLSTNFLKATVASGTNLVLTSPGTSDTVTYKLYADSNATTELKPGIAGYYINGTLINLLGLLGTSAIDEPVYFKLASTNQVTPGTYTGSFVVKWDWYFCSVLGIGTNCIGTTDSGSKNVTVNVTLVVAAKPLTITVNPGITTWNEIEGTSNPKAIPGSKRRLSIAIYNPDIVSADASTIKINLPTPAKTYVALDGDGTTNTAIITGAQDSTPASLTLSYISSSSATDDVDFSSDNGVSWTYYPAPGDPVSQSAVTNVLFKPKGTLPPQKTFTITIPYAVKKTLP